MYPFVTLVVAHITRKWHANNCRSSVIHLMLDSQDAAFQPLGGCAGAEAQGDPAAKCHREALGLCVQ